MNTAVIAKIMQIGIDALRGIIPNPADLARSIVGVGLDLVPESELRDYLTDEARKRGDATFEGLKDAKFGDEEP